MSDDETPDSVRIETTTSLDLTQQELTDTFGALYAWADDWQKWNPSKAERCRILAHRFEDAWLQLLHPDSDWE